MASLSVVVFFGFLVVLSLNFSFSIRWCMASIWNVL